MEKLVHVIILGIELILSESKEKDSFSILQLHNIDYSN